MTVLRDIAFADYPGFRPVALDLHLPGPDALAASGPVPVILQLHGGGWRLGSRGAFSPLVSEADSFGRIVAAGFAVAAADYRLSGEAVFPAQLDDVERAIAWIIEHGAEYGIDPARVVLWGGSAGGTLAALAAFRMPAAIRGVIDWYGPSDLFAMESFTRDAPGISREDQWLGAAVSSVPEVARAASPALQVVAGAPPFHLAHGDRDDAVPLDQSRRLMLALLAAGVEAELEVVPGAGHFWRDVDEQAPLFDAAIAFARRVTA